MYLIDGAYLKLDEQQVAAVAERGIRLEQRVCHTEMDIMLRCADAEGLITMVEPVTRQVIAALPNLKVIARAGVGLDSVDVAAATARGVQVTNVPDGNYREVATHALALILDSVRRVKAFDAQLQDGEWAPLRVGRSMRRTSELTLGLVGFGRVGSELARIALPLGFTVTAVVRPGQEPDVVRAGAIPMPLADMLATADVVSLHVPLTSRTRHLIDRAALQRMKPGSILINVSRDELVDEAAVLDALDTGQLGGAALDVFTSEPLPAGSGLRGRPNVVLTPHVAYMSVDSLADVASKAIGEAVAVLEGRPVRYSVNSPHSHSERTLHP